MECKFYIKHIREKIHECIEYYDKAKEAKEHGELDVSQYFMKIANDEYSHAGILFKLLEDHINKKTEKEEYNGVYKEVYEMSMEVLKDEYKEAEELLRKS